MCWTCDSSAFRGARGHDKMKSKVLNTFGGQALASQPSNLAIGIPAKQVTLLFEALLTMAGIIAASEESDEMR